MSLSFTYLGSIVHNNGESGQEVIQQSDLAHSVAGMTLVSNWQLLHETDLTYITHMIHQWQMRLYGHVASYLKADPAHQVVSARHNPEWRRSRGCPHSLWLQQVDTSCWEILRMGREPA